MDSSVINEIFHTFKRLTAAGGSLRLVVGDERIERVLRIAQVDRVAEILRKNDERNRAGGYEGGRGTVLATVMLLAATLRSFRRDAARIGLARYDTHDERHLRVFEAAELCAARAGKVPVRVGERSKTSTSVVLPTGK